MSEKKTKRLSFRVPGSWQRETQSRHIPYSQICRSAVFSAIKQASNLKGTGAKMRSKEVAASLFNDLLEARVRTITPQMEPLLRQADNKMHWFREIMIEKCTGSTLISLAEFLDQGEFAEEVLNEAYR